MLGGFRASRVAALVLVMVSLCAVGCQHRRRAPEGPVALVGEAPLSVEEGVSEDVTEADLAEMVAHYRAMYRRSLRTLRDYYSAHGYATKRDWAEYELDEVREIKPFRYIMEAEVPASNLVPSETIPEADALYERGRSLMRSGGYGTPALSITHYMVEAAEVYRALIQHYPDSDKIDEAAYYLGEIHGDYLEDQERIAVTWYERCFTWNPETRLPARYKAALLLDFRLRDRTKALELYRASIELEPHNLLQARSAQRRIDHLTRVPASARR